MIERTPREAEFRRIVENDPDIAALLAVMRTFDAPDLWLVSGVLFQSVWRVHLWYPKKFGIPYPQLHCATDGIKQFLIPACMVGICPAKNGFDIFAPLGLDDIFDRLIRPNPLWQGPLRTEYARKAERYRRDWPSVRLAG